MIMMTMPMINSNKAIVLRVLGIFKGWSLFLAMKAQTAPARYSTKAIANKVTKMVLIFGEL